MTHWRGERAVSVILHNEFKSALKKILPIFLSLAGSGFLAFLTQVLLGHTLTVDEFGILSTGLSIAVILTAIIGFGMPSVWLLIFGQEGWHAFRWVHKSFSMLGAWGVIVLAMAWVGLTLVVADERLINTMWWLQTMVVLQVMVELLSAKLQLEARYLTLSFWQTFPHIGRLAVATIVYLTATGTAESVAKGFGAVSAVLIMFALYALSSMTPAKMHLSGHPDNNSQGTQLSGPAPDLVGLLRLAWPYAGTAVLVMLYGRIEIVLLGNMTSPSAAATFSVATAFLLVAFLVPQAIYQRFLLPKIHRWFFSDWQRFLAVYRFGCAAMGLLGVVGTLAMYLFGETLVSFVFGEKYREAGDVLSWLSVCILIRFLSSSIESALMSGDFRKQRLYCQALSALISVPCAYLLIDLYGIKGAVINKVLTELTLLVFFSYVSSRYVMEGATWAGWTLRLRQSEQCGR